jgi:hypothetical protein
MSDTRRSGGVVKWWAMIVVGTAAALLIAWLSDVAGVSLRTVLSIAAGAAALAWLRRRADQPDHARIVLANLIKSGSSAGQIASAVGSSWASVHQRHVAMPSRACIASTPVISRFG